MAHVLYLEVHTSDKTGMKLDDSLSSTTQQEQQLSQVLIQLAIYMFERSYMFVV